MIKVANAPCSWGVLEFEGTDESAGFERVLDEMSAAGFAGTELGDWEFMPTEPAALRRELGQRALEMVGAFVPAALADVRTHEPAIANAIRTAKLIAEVGETPFIVLADDNGIDPVRTRAAGRIEPQMGLSDEQWRCFAEGAEKVARAVADETGLRTVFHHHCAGYVETPAEVARLLDLTDPDLLGLCLDTGHWSYGGGDALSALSDYGDRIWHVHFKDCHPDVAGRAKREALDYFEAVREGVFCELGVGRVDFAGVVAELRRREYDGWIVVEQDVLPGMGTPAESASRNRAFLKTLGL